MSRKFEKSRRNLLNKGEERSGYCQICGAYVNDLTDHASSCKHGLYPSIQYPQLESIFNYCDLGNMGCLKKSLRVVKSPPSDIFEKPSLELPVVTMNGHVPCANIDKAALYNGFFSSERNSYDRNDMSSVESEDEIFKKDESSDEIEGGKGFEVTHSKKSYSERSKVSKKRLSVEEKLIEDNKSYYRVEVLNSKLRSNEYFINQKQLDPSVNVELENGCSSNEIDTKRKNSLLAVKDLEEKKEPVVVRFKKVRKTQLSVLSDEADNFMFGGSARREARKVVSSINSSLVDSSDSRDSETFSSVDEEIPKIKKMVNDSEDSVTQEKYSDSMASPPTLTCDHDSFSESEDDATEDFPCTKIDLDCITFSFENTPKNEPWTEACKRKEEGNREYYYPFHHEYPKLLLPYEYPPSERLKLLSGKKVPGFGRQRGKRAFDDGRPRKSPRCHASTLAVMSNFLRRPLRESSKNLDFSYEEESRSSLPETIDTSSSTSEFRTTFSFMSETLPIEPDDDVFAVALARLACGETSTFDVEPGPCLAVNPAVLEDPPADIEISLQPGLTVPLETIIKKHNVDTSWMEYMDYSCDKEPEMFLGPYINSEVEPKKFTKNEPYCWPELPLRRRRKKIKKEEELTVGPPQVLIKCEPCEVKLEPMSAEILQQYSVSNASVLIKENSKLIKEEGGYGNRKQPSSIKETPPIKRGRGRPRKKVLNSELESPSTDVPSLSRQSSPKTYLKKSAISRFSFIQRSFINQIV